MTNVMGEIKHDLQEKLSDNLFAMFISGFHWAQSTAKALWLES